MSRLNRILPFRRLPEDDPALRGVAERLRAYTPPAAEPSPDLWNRIEAQIRAEESRAVAVRRPIVWLPSAGLAAAAVAAGFVLLHSNPQIANPITDETEAAVARPTAEPLATPTHRERTPPVTPRLSISARSVQVAAVTAAHTPERISASAEPKRLSRRPASLIAANRVVHKEYSPSLSSGTVHASVAAPAAQKELVVAMAATPTAVRTSSVEDTTESAGSTSTDTDTDTGDAQSASVTPPNRILTALVTAASRAEGSAPEETAGPDDAGEADAPPAGAVAVAEMTGSGPLRRQAGLFSYQAH